MRNIYHEITNSPAIINSTSEIFPARILYTPVINLIRKIHVPVIRNEL